MKKLIKKAMLANDIKSIQELANKLKVHKFTAAAIANGSEQISLVTYVNTLKKLGFKLKYNAESLK